MTATFTAAAIYTKYPHGWRCTDAAPILRKHLMGLDMYDTMATVKRREWYWEWLGESWCAGESF